VASAFVILMVPILCFPAVVGANLTAETMNWTCVVYGGPMVMIMIWWAVSARKWFKGPKVNVQHLMLGRVEGGDVLEGQEVVGEVEESGRIGGGGKAGEAAKDGGY
jgi:hypothetical protein